MLCLESVIIVQKLYPDVLVRSRVYCLPVLERLDERLWHQVHCDDLTHNDKCVVDPGLSALHVLLIAFIDYWNLLLLTEQVISFN